MNARPFPKPLHLGSTGLAVAVLQRRIGAFVTSEFDADTQYALMRVQDHHALTPDGVYGPLTNRALTERTPDVVHLLAEQLGVEHAVLQAVVEVEAAGSGFYSDGLPKILLERHYVWKLTSEHERARLGKTNCTPEPGGYSGGYPEWARYAAVAAVAGSAVAAQSCSWGLPQIMGANYAACGCAGLDEFTAAMCQDENSQLGLLAAFLRHERRLLDALKARAWTAFAKGYNGPASVGYDVKLEAAYKRWSRPSA